MLQEGHLRKIDAYIQDRLVSKYGYRASMQSDQAKPKRTLRVTRMKTLNANCFLPESSAMKEVQKQLQEMANNRRIQLVAQQMSAMREKAQGECLAVRMMTERIKEYNFIVDHRHILEKNSSEAKKVMGIAHDDTNERIMGQITKLQQQSFPGCDLERVLRMSGQVNRLYRQHREFSPKTTEREKSAMNVNDIVLGSMRDSIVLSKKFSARESPIKQMKNQQYLSLVNPDSKGNLRRKSSQSLSNSTLRRQKLLQRNRSIRNQRETRKQKLEAQFCKELQKALKGETFLDRDTATKGELIDLKEAHAQEALSHWKSRVEQHQQQVTQAIQAKLTRAARQKLKKEKRLTKLQSEVIIDNQEQIMQEFFFKYKQTACKIKAEKCSPAKTVKTQNGCIQKALLKRHHKFERILGTKCLQRYDAAKEVQSMFESRRVPRARTEPKSVKLQCNFDLPAEIEKERNNEELYWVTCKNEKTNIFLRHK